ncbi:hypothetical protein QYS60_20195 [Rhodococcus sp. GXMU-t2271]|uniref:DUF3618 domain-containing protein n=1 Tax=Rhodococcus indonesiensis TaxID=3055869 RepID=A0ABT7RGH9_9NOCA|nr:hypothetical protein [Rhodococcus indonesiensis]MDM7486733.1 hypothetical protein [Rhodococcus indonesiensis]
MTYSGYPDPGGRSTDPLTEQPFTSPDGPIPEPRHRLDEYRTSRGEPDDASSAQVAQEQAGRVAGRAADAGRDVAGTAGDQAARVKNEATAQAQDVLRRTRDELTDQAARQQKKVAEGLRTLGAQFGSMARDSEQPGMAGDLVRQAADRADTVASWLEQREPGGVLHEVSGFARRRPGAFIALAAGAGFVLGRLGRGLKDADSGSDSATRDSSASYSPAPHSAVPQPPGVAHPGFTAADPGAGGPAGYAYPAQGPGTSVPGTYPAGPATGAPMPGGYSAPGTGTPPPGGYAPPYPGGEVRP